MKSNGAGALGKTTVSSLGYHENSVMSAFGLRAVHTVRIRKV